MSKQIIKADPSLKRESIAKEIDQIKISEFFSKTIQGEGVSCGSPAAFLRLKDCTLNCVWCDTTEVWRSGNAYSVSELLELMEESGLIDDLTKGHHLVITGGSPLKQQNQLAVLLALFQIRFGFVPFIEVENEAVLLPNPSFSQFVSQWNNSPKLENSGMKKQLRYRPEVIAATAQIQNSWFKFVISKVADWEEIETDYLATKLIKRAQIILMPCGMTRQELNLTRELAAEIAIRENVLFSDRLHVTLWDKKTGV
jgi:7-carboxy-7-deazaguanine synthase